MDGSSWLSFSQAFVVCERVVHLVHLTSVVGLSATASVNLGESSVMGCMITQSRLNDYVFQSRELILVTLRLRMQQSEWIGRLEDCRFHLRRDGSGRMKVQLSHCRDVKLMYLQLESVKLSKAAVDWHSIDA